MAKLMERKGNFENVNDEMAITNITETFSNVYSSQWVKLSMWLAKQFPEISEMKLIQSLTSLMKVFTMIGLAYSSFFHNN
jgi:hypothetical protein